MLITTVWGFSSRNCRKQEIAESEGIVGNRSMIPELIGLREENVGGNFRIWQ